MSCKRYRVKDDHRTERTDDDNMEFPPIELHAALLFAFLSICILVILGQYDFFA